MELDFRFDDEDDYEYENFSIPSRARAWASVILAGKRDIAVVFLQRDIARIGRGGGNKLSNVRSF